jgi:hypothetical protein
VDSDEDNEVDVNLDETFTSCCGEEKIKEGPKALSRQILSAETTQTTGSCMHLRRADAKCQDARAL